MLIVGLTGGIATGKSSVTALLRDHGITVIDCDEIAHNVVQQVPGQTPCFVVKLVSKHSVVCSQGRWGYNRTVKAFGSQILLADGTSE